MFPYCHSTTSPQWQSYGEVMGSYGELFPGRKLKHEGDQGAPGREHDPGGPLDLDHGVVFLTPPVKDDEPGKHEDEHAES